MIENKRYITKGVSEKVDILLQVFMWQCIENMNIPKDYLQVFKCSMLDSKLKIEHIRRSLNTSRSISLMKILLFFLLTMVSIRLCYLPRNTKEDKQMKEKIRCSSCGANLTQESMYEFEGQILCINCLDERSVVCDCCGTRLNRDCVDGDDYTTLCNSCYTNYYTCCENCGTLIHNDDAYTLYDDDDHY